MDSVWTVGTLTAYLRQLLEGDPRLREVAVKGEISNVNLYPSGHLYFTLKDAESQISGVMFSAASRLKFEPKDGMKVVAYGRVTVYDKRGQYQIQVADLKPDGLGELYLAFEQLKEKLRNEGLFDEALKRPLPVCPERVGLVTSPAGAAVHDMITILRRRNPGIDIVLSPAVVQGIEAPRSLMEALHRLWRHGGIDVIIIGRGGGSLEELWGFNDEALARAIRRSPVPVVSAVGHETDFTVADFVADRRAPTPSGAAELVAPDRAALLRDARATVQRMMSLLERRAARERSRLALLLERRPFKFPFDRLRDRAQRIDENLRAMRHALSAHCSRHREILGALAAKLEALSPLGVLGRGYLLCHALPDRRLVKRAAETRPGQSLALRFADGEVRCQVAKEPAPPRDGRREAHPEQLLLEI